MATKKAKEYRDQSVEELNAKLQETRRELYDMKSDAQVSKAGTGSHLTRQKRKEIARILTVLREKQEEAKV